MKTFSLSIPKPCSEKWENFTPTEGGGFCSSCSKVVIDFTKMTDQQIIDFVKQKPSHACGRFGPGQLKQYHQFEFANVKPGYMFLKAGVLSALLLLGSKPSVASNPNPDRTQTVQMTKIDDQGEVTLTRSAHYVKGVVRSAEDGLPIPGVNVVVKGTNTGTVTDIDGRFSFNHQLEEGAVLIFSFIGLVTYERVVGPEFMDVVLDSDFQLTGELMVGGPVGVKPNGLRGLWWKVKSWF